MVVRLPDHLLSLFATLALHLPHPRDPLQVLSPLSNKCLHSVLKPSAHQRAVAVLHQAASLRTAPHVLVQASLPLVTQDLHRVSSLRRVQTHEGLPRLPSPSPTHALHPQDKCNLPQVLASLEDFKPCITRV